MEIPSLRSFKVLSSPVWLRSWQNIEQGLGPGDLRGAQQFFQRHEIWGTAGNNSSACRRMWCRQLIVLRMLGMGIVTYCSSSGTRYRFFLKVGPWGYCRSHFVGVVHSSLMFACFFSFKSLPFPHLGFTLQAVLWWTIIKLCMFVYEPEYILVPYRLIASSTVIDSLILGNVKMRLIRLPVMRVW